MSIKSRVSELEKHHNSRPLVIIHRLHNSEGIKKAAEYYVDALERGEQFTVKKFAGSETDELLQIEIRRLQNKRM